MLTAHKRASTTPVPHVCTTIGSLRKCCACPVRTIFLSRSYFWRCTPGDRRPDRHVHPRCCSEFLCVCQVNRRRSRRQHSPPAARKPNMQEVEHHRVEPHQTHSAIVPAARLSPETIDPYRDCPEAGPQPLPQHATVSGLPDLEESTERLNVMRFRSRRKAPSFCGR
jgi:hypothetical protein